MLVRVLPFWLSIGLLSAFQGALVALPSPLRERRLLRLRSGRWALIPPLSVIAFVEASTAAKRVTIVGSTTPTRGWRAVSFEGRLLLS